MPEKCDLIKTGQCTVSAGIGMSPPLPIIKPAGGWTWSKTCFKITYVKYISFC